MDNCLIDFSSLRRISCVFFYLHRNFKVLGDHFWAVYINKMANELFVLAEVDNLNAVFSPLKSAHRIKVSANCINLLRHR